MARALATQLAVLIASSTLASSALIACKECRESEMEEAEEREQTLDHFWRVELVIEGSGAAVSVGPSPAFDCRSVGEPAASDGRDAASRQTGSCGPKLVTFKELQPPLIEGRPSPGWRLQGWKSLLRGKDGVSRPRSGPMPDGRFYINGMGYSDTGVLETVTAVFVRDPDAAAARRPP
jgi:hypothetical protein